MLENLEKLENVAPLVQLMMGKAGSRKKSKRSAKMWSP